MEARLTGSGSVLTEFAGCGVIRNAAPEERAVGNSMRLTSALAIRRKDDGSIGVAVVTRCRGCAQSRTRCRLIR